jgi:multiple sugar transport system substrate-binding protein
VFQRRRGVRRTRLGAPAVAAALLCLVSACTSGGEPSSTPSATPTSPSSSAAGPVALRFAVYGGSSEVAAYRTLAATYHEEHPNVTVRIEPSPDAAAAGVMLNRQFADGTAPDLFLADSTDLPTLVSQDRVQPVDELLEDRGIEFGDNYERLGLEAFAAEARLQCMPSDVSPSVVFYNRRLFSSVRLADPEQPDQPEPTPQTGWGWDLFVTAAQQMSTRDVKGVYLSPELTTLTPLLRSAGADIVDDPSKPTTLSLDDGRAPAAMERILTLARNPRITPTPEQLARRDAVERFEKGELAMIVGTRALVPQLRSVAGLRFDVFPLPSLGRTQTIADVSGYCISKASPHIADALDFLAFAVGDKGAALTAVSGGVVPANLNALHSPSFTQPGRFPLNNEVFTNVMRRADVMPDPPAWPKVVRATRPLLNRLFYAPVIDLDTLLARIDAVSAPLLVPPTPSPSPSESPSESSSESPSGSPSDSSSGSG